MPKVDTIKGQVELAQNVNKIHDVPAHVPIPDGAMPFWESIVRARAYSSWNDHDLEIAAMRARTMYQIEETQKLLDEEGSVIINAKGTPIMNPRHSVLEQLTRKAVALSRITQTHAQATQGDSKDQKKKNTAQKEMRDTMNQYNDDEDDLIPGVH